MSDSEHSTVSYTSISSDFDPSSWGIPLIDVGELPEMDPYEEVAQQGQAALPSPAYVPDPMKLEHHVPVYVPEPVYPEYLVPSDNDIYVEDPEEDPAEELEEDPEEDPVDYVADADDDEEEEEDSSEDDDDEKEEHLAPADSTAIASSAVDHVPSAEEIEPFETDESAATPPHYLHTVLLLGCLSKPRHLYRFLLRQSSRIQLRVASLLPLPAPSTCRKAYIPEADIPPRKRLLLTAPKPRFEVGESSVAAARQPRSTVACRVDYSFMDTVDASIRASERRTMAAIEVVNLRRDRAALRDEVDTLRRYLSSLCTTHEQERVVARQALDRSEAHNRALEAQIIVLETQAYRHEWQHQDANDHTTRAIMCIQALEAGARVDTLEDTGSSC
ncbi:hypothetical protein Tco_0509655 [Tanacetum coccineum]